MSSHNEIVTEIWHEVLAETSRTYENGDPSPTRETYVADVIQQLQNQLDSGFWLEAGR